MIAYTTRFFLAAICVFSLPMALRASEGGTLIVVISEVVRPGSECYGVAPHNDENGALVTVSGLQQGDSVVLDVINQSAANGEAFVSTNATLTTNSGWFPHGIGVTGDDEQTDVSVGEKLRIRARKNGTGGDLAQSPPFAVCAHPTNWEQTNSQVLSDAVLRFDYDWESDCGHLNHLDEVLVDEHVSYPSTDDPYEPPPAFEWTHVNPTVFPTSPLSGTAGEATDTHAHGTLDPDGPTGDYTATQHYRFRCLRCCRIGSNRDVLGWGDIMAGPISITREVFYESPYWKYRITKSGESATCNIATCNP